MADANVIIEGNVKYRDGKKWKSRWCVMRKLSPVADCVQLQLYRDARARRGGCECKASLSLDQYIGTEANFTLDKHSNTLALVCRDTIIVLAFDTRERLLVWQAKLRAHIGDGRSYLVVVKRSGAGRGVGPARLHLREQRAALTTGVPPRLIAEWQLSHIRRYGVVEGKFCFEGGSLCGKGEGLHVLVTEHAHEICREFDLASKDRPQSCRADTRLSELNTIDRSLPPSHLQHYDEACGGDEVGKISPYWPSEECEQYHDMDLGDTASVHSRLPPTCEGVTSVTLERCTSCMSALGVMSRSSTAPLTPAATHFSPAWTMDPLRETTDNIDACPPRPPDRPPKPSRLDLNLNNRPTTCSCTHTAPPRVGPYENYDVPKLSSAEVEGDYYDIPRRFKECISNELFKVTNSSTSEAIILKKPCGCLLKFGKNLRGPTIVDSEENFNPTNCPCQRVTDWANNWIKLPYCKKNTVSSDNLVPNKENVIPNNASSSALYATVDFTRKTRRRPRGYHRQGDASATEIDDGPLANYENLSFALSLEHYENAKDLLRKAGVTQVELDAISANLKSLSYNGINKKNICTQCGHPQQVNENVETITNDDYLIMEPNVIDTTKLELNKSLPSGYTPMSPIGDFALQTSKSHGKSPTNRLFEEKSASNPTLCGTDDNIQSDTNETIQVSRSPRTSVQFIEQIEYRKRSRSADSSRFLEDVKEFEGNIDSHGSNSSIETLRNIALDKRATMPCDCVADNKYSDADSSEASKDARCRVMLTKRSSSVPGKAGGNRDSSSSNDSGVSSCSLRRAGDLPELELPLTSAATRCHYRSVRRAAACCHVTIPRRSRSTDLLGESATIRTLRDPAKSSSAEAEVPVLTAKPLRACSTSSGTSDVSDYIDTSSVCSSHSSADTTDTYRVMRQTTSTLRPRSGNEYLRLHARSMHAPRVPPARPPRLHHSRAP